LKRQRAALEGLADALNRAETLEGDDLECFFCDVREAA
jgi:hypothetical protein